MESRRNENADCEYPQIEGSDSQVRYRQQCFNAISDNSFRVLKAHHLADPTSYNQKIELFPVNRESVGHSKGRAQMRESGETEKKRKRMHSEGFEPPSCGIFLELIHTKALRITARS